MEDYAPPSGPPPPKVPEGWKAVWNAQYSEWFFVNIYTKKSQWEKPTEPVYPPGEGPDQPPHGPPPSYAPAGGTSSDKTSFGSNNPYGGGKSPNPDMSEDERLARRLQEEEQARVNSGGRGAANDFYTQGAPPNQYAGYPQQSASPYSSSYPPAGASGGLGGSAPAQEKGKRGLLGKLLGSSSSSRPHGYSQQHGYPQAYPQAGYGGYYPQQQHMYGRPGRMGGGGMGAGTGAALGLGGGLLGGAMLGSALGDHGDDGNTYIENNDYGGDGGGDYGGDGGGDFGGDGGGDFGGGDF